MLVTEEVQINWYDCRPNQTTIFRKKTAVGAPSFNSLDEALDKDDEISSDDLRKMLQEKAGILVSISTVQRAKNHLG